MGRRQANPAAGPAVKNNGYVKKTPSEKAPAGLAGLPLCPASAGSDPLLPGAAPPVLLTPVLAQQTPKQRLRVRPAVLFPAVRFTLGPPGQTDASSLPLLPSRSSFSCSFPPPAWCSLPHLHLPLFLSPCSPLPPLPSPTSSPEIRSVSPLLLLSLTSFPSQLPFPGAHRSVWNRLGGSS